jgi:hypothetical protein
MVEYDVLLLRFGCRHQRLRFIRRPSGLLKVFWLESNSHCKYIHLVMIILLKFLGFKISNGFVPFISFQGTFNVWSLDDQLLEEIIIIYQSPFCSQILNIWYHWWHSSIFSHNHKESAAYLLRMIEYFYSTRLKIWLQFDRSSCWGVYCYISLFHQAAGCLLSLCIRHFHTFK